MSFEEYWTGKDLDLDALWDDFTNGKDYISKFTSVQVHLLRLVFENNPRQHPLFDHELVYKTVKGTFHDVKAACLTPQAYDKACPIFLYRVDRGSGIYEFLAELTPLLPYVATLAAAMVGYLGFLAKEQDLMEKRLNFLISKFPTASNAYVEKYVSAKTPWGRNDIVRRLIREGHLSRIEISTKPFTGKEQTEEVEMIDVPKLLRSKDAQGDV